MKVMLLIFLMISQAFGASEGLYEPKVNCERFFKHKSKVYPLDSGRKKDGEGLKPFIKDNPEALEYLNNYQSAPKKARWMAVTGTLGILTLISAAIVPSKIGETKVQQRNARWVFIGSGLAITLSSYFAGQYILSRNENNLEKALEIYNNKAPQDQKIQLGFDIDPVAKTGQLTTEVKW